MNTTPDIDNTRTASETFRSWLSEINAQFQTEFAFDDSGLAGIEFDSGEVLRMQIVEDDCLYLYAVLLELGESVPSDFLLAVLTLNVYDTTEMGGSIGYDPEIHSLVYTERLRKAFATPFELAMRIDAFPKTLQRLRHEVVLFKEESAVQEVAPDHSQTLIHTNRA